MALNLWPQIDRALGHTLSTSELLRAFDVLAGEFRRGESFRSRMQALLASHGVPAQEIDEGLDGVAAFLNPSSLRLKLRRELGSADPFALTRSDFTRPVFEAWAPLGVLVHVTPANAWSVGFLSVVEGLLAGNINVLKLSAQDSDFAVEALQRLGELDRTGVLAQRTVCVRVSSRDRAAMRELLSYADGVAAWGGEEAIRGLRELSPEGARFIDWGPKISFAYFTPSSVSEERLDALVREVCEGDQQACSAPQAVYLETDSAQELQQFAQALARAFARIAPQIAGRKPDPAELSEVTVVTRLQELKHALGEGDVIKGEGWRLLLDGKEGLRPSPLYRSLWVKKIRRSQLAATLRPLRRYLQTVGLACETHELNPLTQALTTAGVLRITPVGSMMSSYEGEPHDGVYALARYARRISLQGEAALASVGRLAELAQTTTAPRAGEIMQKADFQALEVEDRLAPLTFRSGGSSGDPKFSHFTYPDYHAQMRLAGYGLLAAGLDPVNDRAMNLFFGGGLYGGFISFFTILESLGATQFPMAALPDHLAVGESILRHRVDTLLGMPSYLMQLFAANDEVFRAHRPIKKIFYGGEHFQTAQKEYLREAYGVELIKSAAYGSVDAGPIGYQCSHSQGSVHHMHTDAHSFEVVGVEDDRPVEVGEVGRLLVTTHLREGQRIERYDLGDLVKLLPAGCGCGRAGLRLELMGRHGDVVRVGASFFNYARIARILSDELNYSGEMQLVVRGGTTASTPESLMLVVEEDHAPSDPQIEEVLLRCEPDFREAVELDRVLSWSVHRVPRADLRRHPASGKLIHIIDERQR